MSSSKDALECESPARDKFHAPFRESDNQQGPSAKGRNAAPHRDLDTAKLSFYSNAGLPHIRRPFMLPIIINVLLVIHVLVSLFIILLVLMQRPKNEGLGAAFGGGATDQLFGAQTTNVLQTITRWLGGIFFALTLLLSILYVKQGGGRSPIQDKLSAKTEIPAPPAPPAPAGGPPLPADGATPVLDGKEPFKLEVAPPEPGGAVSDPVSGKPTLPAPELEKMPDKPAPAAPVLPPAEKKPDAPAPEPKPAEPAK